MSIYTQVLSSGEAVEKTRIARPPQTQRKLRLLQSGFWRTLHATKPPIVRNGSHLNTYLLMGVLPNKPNKVYRWKTLTK